MAVAVATAAAISVGVSGCGGDPREAAVTDYGALTSIVSDLSNAVDDTVSEGRVEELFVEGSAPAVADRAKYGSPRMFRIKGEPEITGDTANFTVEILRRPDDPDADPEVVGEQQWSAEKIGGIWLLKSVPLP